MFPQKNCCSATAYSALIRLLLTSFTAANGGSPLTSSFNGGELQDRKWLITPRLLRNVLPHCLQATCNWFSWFSLLHPFPLFLGLTALLAISILNSWLVKCKSKNASEEISTIATWFAWCSQLTELSFNFFYNFFSILGKDVRKKRLFPKPLHLVAFTDLSLIENFTFCAAF